VGKKRNQNPFRDVPIGTEVRIRRTGEDEWQAEIFVDAIRMALSFSTSAIAVLMKAGRALAR
jgi:hypothetical protein